jgi:hypothetical protein
MGTPKCSTVGGSPSLSTTAQVIKRSPVGAPDENTFRALMRYPPSTFSAFPEPGIQSDPPLDTSWMRSVATRLSNGSTAVKP